MSNPSDCAKSISAMVKEWTQPVLAGGINIPPNLIDRRMARFEPSPALAALAMRERAADMMETHVVETQFDGSRVVVPSPMAREDQHHRSLAKAIRALPTTFTDAELLAAARLLPEVRALIEAATPFSQAVIRNGGPVAGAIGRTDITNIRAALAPFMKGAS